MARHEWDGRYITGETPWDSGKPDEHLAELLRAVDVRKGRALDVGCGTGTNAIWLAEQGFAVLGVDVAPTGIDKARAKLAGRDLDCRFEVLDFLHDTVSGGPYDLVFDRGCFHVFDEAEARDRFARRVGSLLKPHGRWLSLIGSTEGPARDFGPPRRSARDVANAVEPALEILELRSIEFREAVPAPAAAWFCLSRPRSIVAQPSTRRE